MKYFVTGLPRTRTTWFSAYFNGLGSLCAHEALNGCETREEFYERMNFYDGNSDCGLVFTDFQEKFDHRTVVIHRNPGEVHASLKKIGLPMQWASIVNISNLLNKLPGLHVRYEDIDERLPEITKYVGLDYNDAVAETYKNMSITPRTITGNLRSLQIWLG